MCTIKKIFTILLVVLPLFVSAITSKAFKYDKEVKINWVTPSSASSIREICFSPKTKVESDVCFAVAHKNGFISIFTNDKYTLKDSERNSLDQKISFNLYSNKNLATEEEQKKLNNGQGTLKFTSDGKYLLSGGWIYYDKIKQKYCSLIHIFDMDKLDLKKSDVFNQTPHDYTSLFVEGIVWKFDISPDNKKVLVSHQLSNNMNVITIIDIESHKKEWSDVIKEEPVDVIFGENSSTIFYTQGKDIIQYYVPDNKEIQRFSTKKENVCRLFCAGKTLICSDFLNKLYYWDVSKNEKPTEIKTKEYITEIQYLNGSMLATLSGFFIGGGNGNIYEADIYNKKIYPISWIYTCEKCPYIRKITMSGNGRMFAYFNNENGIIIQGK